MPDKSNNPLNFWQELKRRKVLRVITVYAAVAFVILQLVEILAPSLRLPDWTMNFILVVLIVGFIIAIILSWIYDIHPEGGIVKTEPAHKAKIEEIPKSSSSWKIASYISFVVIIALIVLNIIPRKNLSVKRDSLEKSIAVIPFIDDSPNKDNEHIINGIMDELIINLQSIKDLRIPGRTSIEQYRNNPKPIPEIARELGVNYIVEGSGQKLGNTFTLRVQLLEGAKDKHLWGDAFVQEIESVEDIVSFISGIAKSIAGQLETIITPEEQQLIEKVHTTSLTAYDFYQRGREEQINYWLDNDNREALERAEDLYRDALEYDSTFALAYTGLAEVYNDKYYRVTFLTENFLDSMLILANTALSFDDQLAEAYKVRGDYYRLNNKKEQAINEYDKAIRFNPNSWEVYRSKGGWLYFNDDLVKSIDNLHKAASLHRGLFLPRIYRRLGYSYALAGFKETSYYYLIEALKLDNDSAVYYSYMERIENESGNFEKAIKYGEKSYALDSTNSQVLLYLGFNHMLLNQFEEFLEYMKKFERELNNRDIPYGRGHVMIGHAYWVNGFKAEAEYHFKTDLEFHIKMLELDRHYWQDINTFYKLANAYSFLGDRNKAYEFLRLVNQRQRMSIWMVTNINNDPRFDTIRDDQEFQQIVKDVEAKYQAEHERVRKWLEENDML